MYTSVSDQCLRVMTAAESERIPSLDVIQKLPTIQMGFAKAYRASGKKRANALEILRRSAVVEPRSGSYEFERQLPAIITGENPDWKPWRVDFYPARLKIYFVNKSYQDPRYIATGGTSIDSTGHFRSCGYAYLIAPKSVGLSFVIAELDWRIWWKLTGAVPESPHIVHFSEVHNGVLTDDLTRRLPKLEPFVPEPSYRP